MLARLLGIAALLLAAAAPATATTAGGAAPTPAPTVMRVVCVSECAGATTARPGSVVRVRGRSLKLVERVVFLGARGGGDDADAVPIATRSASVDVVVPRSAVSGRLIAVNADGEQSRASAKTAITIEPGAPGSRAGLRSADGSAPQIDVEVQTHKVFFGAERRATLVYLVRDAAPVTVRVELVRLEDGAVVARWEPGLVAPDAPQTVAWDGLVDGLVPKDGRFAFRVYAENAQGVRAQTASAGSESASFFFARHKFPIRGPHDYGEFVASYGGGRGHQGQDVFARCGTPLVAARGGVVKIKQTHTRAGNYVVIDGDGTDVDYVYMHLHRPAIVEKGERVYTGQRIGEVGQTGRASGCHLHFEMWTGPGWYTGGSPFDPLPSLRAWDAHS